MLLTRRHLLQTGAALGLAPLWACGGPTAPPPEATYWVSAQGLGDAAGLAVVRAEDGRVTLVPTGFRGHDVAPNLTRPQEVVLFGRRPATRSAVIDIHEGRVLRSLEASPGYAFQGHGFFTPDGRHLITTEAHLETGAGALGVLDASDYSRIDQLETFGVGPHEAMLMPDARTVVVANGGLLTRPETGREVLNLDTMDSSLVYLDLQSGERLEQWRIDEPKASIRHLDVAEDGTVAFGVQVQREATDHDRVVPLTATHQRGAPIRMFEQGLDLAGAMNDYVGSVVIRRDAKIAGFTSPRGNVAAFWSLDDGALLAHHALADCCGLAESVDGAHFVLTSSIGEVRCLRTDDLQEQVDLRRRLPEVLWDNHLITVTA